MASHPLSPAGALAILLLAASALAQVDPKGRSVLFVRGADGSGGLGLGTPQWRTSNLSDIRDTSTAQDNHGYGQLAFVLWLDGFLVEQWIESDGQLTFARLAPHRIVVFGSNNRSYAQSEVLAFHAYVDAGGSALFMSDAHWGPTIGAAPNSDNQFLDRYGVEVYQDNGGLIGYWRGEPGRYLLPDHPVLSGPDGAGGRDDVVVFHGEGVSPFHVRPGSRAVELVKVSHILLRGNTPNGAPGPLIQPGPGDTFLFAWSSGSSRIVGTLDRNTFFNENGIGSDLWTWDNAQLAVNMFRYLAAGPATTAAVGTGCGRAAGGPSFTTSAPVLGTSMRFQLSAGPPSAALSILFAAGEPSPTPLGGGCVLQLAPAALFAVPVGATDPSGAFTWTFPLPHGHAPGGSVVSAQAAVLAAGGPALGAAELSNAVRLRLGFPD